MTGTPIRPLDEERVIVRTGGREVAVEAACPHRKGQLRHGYLNPRTGRITCPLHHSTFDLPSGRRVSGPACRDLRVQPWPPSAPPEPGADDEERGARMNIHGVQDPPEGDPRRPRDPRTVVVYSDLSCSFAHLAVHRLHEARTRLRLDGRVWLDHRAFPLELFNRNINERPGVDSEVSVVGALDPAAGWRLWQGPDWTYPVTMLPPLEAVQAAKAQGWDASEQLDRALRQALWGAGACVSMRHVILDVAASTEAVDVDRLAADLDSGRFRPAVMEQFESARDGRVVCSPHVFLADGTNAANPGIDVRWVNGGFGVGFPVIDADDPAVYDGLLLQAARMAGAAAS